MYLSKFDHRKLVCMLRISNECERDCQWSRIIANITYEIGLFSASEMMLNVAYRLRVQKTLTLRLSLRESQEFDYPSPIANYLVYDLVTDMPQ